MNTEQLALTPGAVAARIGIPTSEWAGKCHGISLAVAPLVAGVVRRGLFTGEVKLDSYFGQRGGVYQHSWVELVNGLVLDPTRHAFAGGPVMLWIGPNDEYDIGGCKSQHPSGMSPFQTSEPTVVLNVDSIQYFADLFDGTAEVWFAPDGESGEILLTVEQALWFANLPVKEREAPGVLARWFAAEGYEALVRAGQKALIPIDRLDWILPEHREIRWQ